MDLANGIKKMAADFDENKSKNIIKNAIKNTIIK